MMQKWQKLGPYLTLRLSELDDKLFEQFLLHFLNAGISLTANRHGRAHTRRIISAETYASARGRKQYGIDLRVEVERGEVWCFQCKRRKKWTVHETKQAIEEAEDNYSANHYFLAVANNPSAAVHEEVHRRPNWEFWNLDRICEEVRMRVPPALLPQVLSVLQLSSSELKRFAPFATERLISPEAFFGRFLDKAKLFHHTWQLVGREATLKKIDRFIEKGKEKALILFAGGGSGKSRLLWECCRRWKKDHPDWEILCLNPHSRDAVDFAFLSEPKKRIILIDDAHRLEQAPTELLAPAARNEKTKLLFAMRPQGLEALQAKLFEAGLGDNIAYHKLPRLKRKEVEALAREALPNASQNQIRRLVELTRESPFLTVIAGELLKREKLSWEGWADNDEFRQHIFRTFEEENLSPVGMSDRDLSRALLRIVALLGPVSLEADFAKRAAECLKASSFSIETLINRLTAIKLILTVGGQSRVFPDLFSDFLVFDACYASVSKTPAFAEEVFKAFPENTALILRNLAEATWIARSRGLNVDGILRPLVDRELERFKQATFEERARILDHWSEFAVFLPAETLELAHLAVKEKTPGNLTSLKSSLFSLSEIDTYDYLIERLAQLLTPVAKYNEKYRHAALDILWNCGSLQTWKKLVGSNQAHPWTAIAEVIKFEPGKPVGVVLEALNWLRNKTDSPGALELLENPDPILQTFLGPCFKRFVEFSEFEGRTFSWWQEPVSLENTRRIRQTALEIIKNVIEKGPWLAAFHGLSALSNAIARVAPSETANLNIQAKSRFLKAWRPERLEALALYRKALERHPQVAVRYEIRQTLKRNLAYEEDLAFAIECHKALNSIPEDLELRGALVLLEQGFFEYGEELKGLSGSERIEKAKDAWEREIEIIADEIIKAHPDVEALFEFFSILCGDLIKAGFYPNFLNFYAAVRRKNPRLAIQLADRIVSSGKATPLANNWPVLMEGNDVLSSDERYSLVEKAAQNPIHGISEALLLTFARKAARENSAFDYRERKLLVDLATQATQTQSIQLLQLVKWASEKHIRWASAILEKLPLKRYAGKIVNNILKALAPIEPRKTLLERKIVKRVLEQMITVKSFAGYQYEEEFQRLCESYPVEIVQFLIGRIEHALVMDKQGDFHPIPSVHRGRLDLSNIKESVDYPEIVEYLWSKAIDFKTPGAKDWLRLFQAVAIGDSQFWLPRLRNALEDAESVKELFWLAGIIHFEGSLVIFLQPDLAKRFLERASEIGGKNLMEDMRGRLYNGCGPDIRSFTNGKLNRQLDYVEAEATKAAEKHAEDAELGPFYRWIAEVEQKDRNRNRMRYEADIAAFE